MNPSPNEIRTRRKQAGLSQSQAAALLHITTSAWKHYEAGRRNMHPSSWELFELKTRRMSE